MYHSNVPIPPAATSKAVEERKYIEEEDDDEAFIERSRASIEEDNASIRRSKRHLEHLDVVLEAASECFRVTDEFFKGEKDAATYFRERSKAGEKLQRAIAAHLEEEKPK
jgi:hypothetical protein